MNDAALLAGVPLEAAQAVDNIGALLGQTTEVPAAPSAPAQDQPAASAVAGQTVAAPAAQAQGESKPVASNAEQASTVDFTPKSEYATPTTNLSPAAQSLQQRMQKAQNTADGTNTGTTSLGVDSTAQSGAGVQPTVAVNNSGVTQARTGQPVGTTGATAVGSNPTAKGSGGLALAPKTSIKRFYEVRDQVHAQKPGVSIVLSRAPLTEEQKVASAFANVVGGTFTLVEDDANSGNMPNGFVDGYQGRNYYIDAKSTRAPLIVAVHESVHGLPDHIRKPLIKALNAMAPAAAKREFLNDNGYTKSSKADQAEEIGAYLSQVSAQRPEFWQELRTKMGNRDFAALATHILNKFKELAGLMKSRADDTFLDRHFNQGDIAKMRGLITDAYVQAMQEQGLTPDAAVTGGPVMAQKAEAEFTPTAATAEEIEQADAYEAENGIRPYTSEGQLQIPFALKQQYGEKDLAKGRENHPLLGLPMNKDGTVTLYYPATNEAARQLAKDKVLRGATPQSTRIYLTNESSGPKVMNAPGEIDQQLGGANVMVMIDPSYIHVGQEYEDGRKDFFIPIAEGKAFAEKMKMVKLFTVDGPRNKAISKSVTMNDIAAGVTTGVESYMAMTQKEKTARHKAAKAALMAAHNVGTLLGENGKLQKTRVGDYGLRDEATDKSVASMGLGLASAQKINEKLSTCPQSARCESLCLSDTSGQNLLYGGDGQFRSGPRMSQYLKTEALVLSPEDFSIVLAREIESFVRWADSEKGFEMLPGADGEKVQTPKQSYKPAIRLNVTSDFPPKVFEALIKAFPQVEFYDYTKLNSDSISENHHLTYSSTGVLQKVDGKVIGKGEGLASGKGTVKSNWDAMVKKMERGFNVAMAFTSRNDIPKFLKDEKTGQTFEVWDGDNYDARFLDPARYTPEGQRIGMIIGLTNKDRTGKPEDSALKHDGFFVDYDKARDGDTLVIQDQEALASGRKVIPIKAAQAEPELAFSNKQNLDQDIELTIPLEGGKTAKMTVNAQTYLAQLDARQEALTMVKECMA
jgi:hypothetical protein